MKINTFQRAALVAYNDGEFAHLAEHADDQFCEALELCGDGLLKFIMVELGDKEDCVTWDDAIGRMETVACEIMQVTEALRIRQVNDGEPA